MKGYNKKTMRRTNLIDIVISCLFCLKVGSHYTDCLRGCALCRGDPQSSWEHAIPIYPCREWIYPFRLTLLKDKGCRPNSGMDKSIPYKENWDDEDKQLALPSSRATPSRHPVLDTGSTWRRTGLVGVALSYIDPESSSG